MLAPIVTKDMRLFPTRPLPPHVKNVRTRAQSLQDFAAASDRRQQQQQTRAAAAQLPRQRNSASTGNLMINVHRAAALRSPSSRQPLDSISEEHSHSHDASPSSTISKTRNAAAATRLIADANGNPPSPSSASSSSKDGAAASNYGQLVRVPAINLLAVKHSPCEASASDGGGGDDDFAATKPEASKSKGKTLARLFSNPFKSRSTRTNTTATDTAATAAAQAAAAAQSPAT